MDRTQLISNVRSNLAGLGRGSLGVPVLLLAMLAMMTLPIPPFLLDVLFTFNIALSIVVLLVCVYALRPLDFAVFPTILLVATLLRLALNVASTRVVLLHGHDGHGAAGKVIQAFGEVVIGGNYVVGVVVFAILMIINFVVVTKGAGRISEVSARFTLDAMPGKQMAIDADLNAGLIEQEGSQEAPQRGGPGGRLLRFDGRCQQVRPRRRHRRPADSLHQPDRRRRHRHDPAFDVLRRCRQGLRPADHR
ncbi:flagellar biosynthesis protein FlhA [Pseudomonas aeruginosa]|nr:flagellar biosynthesis protein FlhA [Pseudomonas aeruginosa]